MATGKLHFITDSEQFSSRAQEDSNYFRDSASNLTSFNRKKIKIIDHQSLGIQTPKKHNTWGSVLGCNNHDSYVHFTDLCIICLNKNVLNMVWMWTQRTYQMRKLTSHMENISSFRLWWLQHIWKRKKKVENGNKRLEKQQVQHLTSI